MSFYILRKISLLTILTKLLSASYAGPLYNAIEDTFAGTSYIAPSHANVEKALHLFSELFSSHKVDRPGWDSLGFEIQEIGHFIIVKEKAGHQNGKGVYVFNKSATHHRVLEAPHRPTDIHTGRIAAHLMESGEFSAGGFNTVRRDTLPDDQSNYTKADPSYFNAFTQAFGKIHPHGNIIQIHAFDANKHEEALVENIDVILSPTTKTIPEKFATYSHCLKNLSLTVAEYPKDIQILGGTLNINAKKFREIGANGTFIHVEMKRTLRDRLNTDSEFRKTFFDCLLK